MANTLVGVVFSHVLTVSWEQHSRELSEAARRIPQASSPHAAASALRVPAGCLPCTKGAAHLVARTMGDVNDGDIGDAARAGHDIGESTSGRNLGSWGGCRPRRQS